MLAPSQAITGWLMPDAGGTPVLPVVEVLLADALGKPQPGDDQHRPYSFAGRPVKDRPYFFTWRQRQESGSCHSPTVSVTSIVSPTAKSARSVRRIRKPQFVARPGSRGLELR